MTWTDEGWLHELETPLFTGIAINPLGTGWRGEVRPHGLHVYRKAPFRSEGHKTASEAKRAVEEYLASIGYHEPVAS